MDVFNKSTQTVANNNKGIYMKQFLFILLIVTTICSAECFNQTRGDIRYVGYNKIGNYKAINTWMNLSSETAIDVCFEPIFYTNDNTRSIEKVTITADHTERTVIISHRTTKTENGTTYWSNDVLVQFMDEYGITHHTMSVKYDMPVAIYKKICSST